MSDPADELVISLAITTTPWIPARVQSYNRLLAQLLGPRFDDVHTKTFREKAPIAVWSEDMWTWAAAEGSEWSLFLQDDIILCDRYLLCVDAMLRSAPGPLVGLETVHPAAKTVARDGTFRRWCSTADGLIGRAYAIRTDYLREVFLPWRANLKVGGTAAITEDTMFGVHALAVGERIYHPIPALQLHDLAIDSAQGNDGDAFRRASVLWSDGDVCGWTASDLCRPGFWKCATFKTSLDGGAPLERVAHPHFGRLWAVTPWLGKKWVKGWTDEVHARALADVCPSPYVARSTPL